MKRLLIKNESVNDLLQLPAAYTPILMIKNLSNFVGGVFYSPKMHSLKKFILSKSVCPVNYWICEKVCTYIQYSIHCFILCITHLNDLLINTRV